MVLDTQRPDVNGTAPRMFEIAEAVKPLSAGVPFFKVECDDNLCSSVVVRGSFQPRDQWANGIFQNSPHFVVRVAPKTRYYTPGDDVTLELLSGSKVAKLRKYTAQPAKVIAKLKGWLNHQP